MIVRRYNGFGGVEHQIEHISKGLVLEGWKVFLLTDRLSPFSEALTQNGVKVIVVSFGNCLRSGFLIRQICIKYKIQFIQAHMFNEDIRCRFAKLLYPRLKHIYRVHTYIDCSFISDLKKNLYHLIAYMTDRLVDYYLPINRLNKIELEMRSKVKSSKILIVHDAVREFDVSSDHEKFLKNKKLVMIANFDEVKGHEIAVEGLKKLKDKGYKFELGLIGGVPKQGTEEEDSTILNKIQMMIRKFDLDKDIVFYGYLTDIGEVLKNYETVILTSYSEGTPNCLLEGMKMRKLVISSKVGGVPEFISDGLNGFLFYPNTAEEFANKVENVYQKENGELDTIIENGWRTVEKKFSIKNMINRLICIYDYLDSKNPIAYF